uniref:Uncharacterized protein n=1 Tax=Opuntia streptacantha TaxID=393608 RepID=A0A7C9EUC0_OPUST
MQPKKAGHSPTKDPLQTCLGFFPRDPRAATEGDGVITGIWVERDCDVLCFLRDADGVGLDMSLIVCEVLRDWWPPACLHSLIRRMTSSLFTLTRSSLCSSSETLNSFLSSVIRPSLSQLMASD